MIHHFDGKNRFLVTQPSHAWLAGQIAQFWGNEEFETPEPWSELCLAAEQHDSGWIEWELYPQWDPKTGLPYNFLDMPLSSHLNIWSKGSELALPMNSYAALLISRHNSFLLELHDFEKESKENIRGADDFREGQMKLQYDLLEDLSSDSYYRDFIEGKILERNQLLLRTWDYISLLLCMGINKEEIVHEVPVNTEKRTEMKIFPIEGLVNTFLMDPWPFNRGRIEVFCEGRDCNEVFKNDLEMHDYLKKESLKRVSFSLVAE